jgi:hypothetical protein
LTGIEKVLSYGYDFVATNNQALYFGTVGVVEVKQKALK